jgi:hypothetical protein
MGVIKSYTLACHAMQVKELADNLLSNYSLKDGHTKETIMDTIRNKCRGMQRASKKAKLGKYDLVQYHEHRCI